MATKILINSVKALRAPHCHHGVDEKKTESVSGDMPDNLLATNVSCTYQCVGKELKDKILNLNFKPTEEKLNPGDGTSSEWDQSGPTYTNVLWASLSSYLKIWGNDSCLRYAIDKCGSIDQVQSANSYKMTSGSWSYDYKVDCEGNTEVISPFADSSGAQKILHTDSTPLKSSHEFNTEVGSLIEYPGKSNPEEDKKCKNILVGNLCFGDCVADNPIKGAGWIELLQSKDKEYITKDTLKICGDKLIDQLSNKNISRSVKINLCEKFYWKTIYELRATGVSCQAARGNINCDQIIKE